MRKNSTTVFALMCIAFLLLLAGCGSPSGRIPLPSSSLTPPVGQSRPIHVATTPTNLSIPTLSPTPLPSQAEMKRSFETEVSLLVQKLLAAKPDPTASISADDELLYIPQTERLYAVQTILGFTHSISSGSGKQVYILYNVLRGVDLTKDSQNNYMTSTQVDTQAVVSSFRLVVESDGKFSLVERKDGTGGDGSTSYQDLITRSVLPLEKLPKDLQGRVERDLEEIIGYACGIDMRSDLDETTRAIALSQTLESSEWADKRQGLEALMNLTNLPAGLAPVLLAHLNDGRFSFEVGELLAKMGVDPSVFNQAIEAARSPDPKTRKGAAAVLGTIPGQEATTTPILMGLLRDEDESVREEAAWQLGSNNAPGVVQLLITALDDPDETYRLAVLDALSYMLERAAPAVPKLVATLPGSSPTVQREIYRVLGIIGKDAQDAAPALERALREETDPDTFSAEASALLEIIGKDATLPLLKETLASPQAEIRIRTGSLLSANFAKVPGVLSLVASALGDSEERVRWEATYAINSILGQRRQDKIPGWPGEEERDIVPALFQALHDSSYEIKDQAGLALTMINDTRSVELDEAIKNEDLVVISRVYRLYIERGQVGSEAALIKALDKYGTQQMAEDFLNCGNSLLDVAARKWAETNHYTIRNAPGGSGNPAWGSGQ